MNILTIVVIAVILFFGVIGHSKGFIRMLLSIASLAITLYVAIIISPKISVALQNSSLYDSVYESSFEYVESKMPIDASNNVSSVVEGLSLPELLKDYVIEKSEGIVTTQAAVVTEAIAKQLTEIIFNVIVFLVTFIAAMVIVKLICAAVNIVSYLPIIHGINQTAGLIVGLIEGLVIVWVFFIVIGLAGNSEFATTIYIQINESTILQYIYNHNFIMNALFMK